MPADDQKRSIHELLVSTTDRLANAFAFDVLTQEGFEAGAKYLLKRGYR